MSSQGYGKMQRAKNSFVPRDNPYLRPKASILISFPLVSYSVQNGTTFISQLGSSVKGFVASFFTYTPKEEEVPQEQYHREEKPVAQEPKDKVINILQNTPQISHTQYEQITKLLQEKVSESPQNIPPAVSTNTMQTAIPKNIVQTSPSNHKPAIPAQPTSAPLKPVPIHAKTVTPIDIVGRFVYKSKDGNTSPKGNGQLGLSGLQPSYVQKPGTSFVPYVPSHSMKRGRSDIPQQQQQISPQSQRGQAYYPVEEDGTIERQPPQKQRKLAPLEYTNGGGQIRSASETAKRILQLVDNMSTPLNDARTPKFRSVLSKDPRLTSSKTPQSGGMKRLDRPPIPRYNRTVTSMNFEENAPDMPPTESLYTPSTRKPYQRPTPADSIKKPTKIAYEEEEEEPQPQLTRKTKPTRERSEPYKRATKEVCDLEEDEGIQIPGYTKTVLPFPTSNVPKFTEPVKSTSTKVDTLSSSDEDQPIPKTNGAKAKQTEEAKKTPEAPKKFQESPITTSSFTETTTGFLGFTAEKKETTAPAFPSKVEEPKKQEEEVKSFLSFAQKEPAKQEEKPKAEPEKVPAFTGFGKVEDRQLFGKTEDTLPATALSFFAKSLEKPVLEKSDDKPAVSLIPTPFTETTFGKPADSKETKEPEEKKETQPPYKFDTADKLDKPFNMESPFQLGKPVETPKVDTDLTRTMFPLNVEPSKISEAISFGKTELKPVEVKVEFKVDAFKPIDLKPATDTKAPEIKTETKQAEVVGTTATQESTTIPPFGTAFGTNTTGSSFGTIPPTGTSGFGFQTQAAPETDKSHETTMEMNDEKPSMPASTTPAFGSTPAPVFGGFGTSTQSSFAFGQTDSTPSTFGQNTNSSTGLFAFAAPGTTSFTSTASTNGEFVFGETPSTPAPAFGQTNPQSQSSIAFSSTPQGFGTSTPAFGSTAVPAFGNISQPAFSNTPSPAFSNSAPTFGSTPAFGNTSTPAFGNASTPAFGNASTPAFGNASTPAFGNASTPAFGNASTPAFGNASTPAFGTPTPTFGSGSSFNFGANSAPAFGANSAPAFGANAAPAFGAPAQPFPTPFGSTSTPSFGAFDGTAGGFSIGTAADSGRKKLKGKRSGKK